MSTAYAQSLQLTIDELSKLASNTGNPAETLSNVVMLISSRFGTDVCSVYLLEPDRAHLVLAATVGLKEQGIGIIRMSIHEGLAGMVAEQLQPVAVQDAFRHPRFKYFQELGEDSFHSFLGVPLIDGGLLQGVMVVQTVAAREFTADEIRLLKDAGEQVTPLVSEARSLDQFVTPSYRRLWAIARNLWWSWDTEATNLFRDLDPVRWRELDHNPIALLSEIPMDKLREKVGQLVLHSRINYAFRRMQEYVNSDREWAQRHAGVLRARPVAYFSAEFGVHESLPIYSGGLGVLAGDHVKSASDLGVPLIAIGLFYDQGYFRQRLDLTGLQQEDYIDLDVRQLPITPAIGMDGKPVVVRIETRSGVIAARVWKVAVGRITMLLLDSDVEGNDPVDRELTARLYGGDGRVRIRQELILGVGGVRALQAMGISPGCLHLNEGHSAFASLERIRHHMSLEGIGFDHACRRVAREICFTTHTPVPAGHDRFGSDLIDEHLGPLRDALGISHDHLMSLGRVETHNHHEQFCMTVLALKLCRRANAVSSLHGDVSRAMWNCLYPGRTAEEVPIGHITNGVHVLSWLAPQMHQLYDRHLGPDWRKQNGVPEVWEKIENVNDAELWETHLALKGRLLEFARRRSVAQAQRRGDSDAVIATLKRAFIPDALTIGFARRFATYKRADLVLQDLEILASLMNNPQMPIQFVFAGKAHPHDRPGKEILQKIAKLMKEPRFAGKLVFVEDYDINVGRHLVQGVDVWLNNPRRPLEASGTSGEKVVLNGGLNLSVLDGWWAEAYDGSNGFAIGMGETHSNTEIHDRRDGEALLKSLKEEVIPLFYRRDRDGLPREWIARMKRCIRTLGWRFNADRMVMDYVLKSYMPAVGGNSSSMPRE